MKYYSEKTDEIYETEKELKAAEKAFDEAEKEKEAKKSKRAEDAKKVEDLYKEAYEAYKVANEAMQDFIREHGSFHTSITGSSLPLIGFGFCDSLFDLL